MKTKLIKLACGAALLGAMAVDASHHAQAQGFSYSGGNGTPLTVTLDSDLQFTVTQAITDNGGAIIFYDNTAFSTSQAFQQDNSAVVSGLVLTDSRTGIIPAMTGSSFDGCCSSYDDSFFYGYFTANNICNIQVGDVLTLSAGSATTQYAFNAPAPTPSDSFVVKNNYGVQIGAGTFAPVPEPSTLALAGLGGLGLLRFRRRE
jgi:hypothetical protein